MRSLGEDSCKILGEYSRDFGRGFARIHEYFVRAITRMRLQGFARICKFLGEDSQGL